MSREQHTPGPWRTGQSAVYKTVSDAEGNLICFAAMKENDKANAFLIAAAPDLLEATEDALKMLEELQDKHLAHCAAVVRALVQNRIDQARAAIAQARGESCA